VTIRGSRATGASDPLRGPVSPAPDQATQPAVRSRAATETCRSAYDPAERLAYSVDEAVRLTGLSRDLLYDEMRRGNLIYVKVGRRRLITRHHLLQFLGEDSP
jgi:excisionase family DNA binding protein